MLKVLIADSYCLSRAGLFSILSNRPGIDVVCQSLDSRQIITDIKNFQPDVVVLDTHIQPVKAIEVIKESIQCKLGCRFLILANEPADESLIDLLRIGASGCILKEVDENYLIQSIIDVAENRSPISPTIAFELLNFVRVQRDLVFTDPRKNPLTQREYMVLKLLSEGLQNKIIGHQLDITERTVEAHVRNILKKLNATSRTHAVVLASRNGWISGV